MGQTFCWLPSKGALPTIFAASILSDPELRGGWSRCLHYTTLNAYSDMSRSPHCPYDPELQE